MDRDDAAVAAAAIVGAVLIAVLTAIGAVLAVLYAVRGDAHLLAAYAFFSVPSVAAYCVYRYLRRAR